MEELKINTDSNSLAFLWYLATIKRFDAVEICRVIETPKQNQAMYNQFLKQKGRVWEQ
tara:strand:+ start:1299 stop:1472 length:174 start_codon:yes stop_codon:yes gene_type:complete